MKQEREVICPYCNISFRTTQWNKVFCCHLHRVEMYQLMKRKELFKLSENEKKLFNHYRKN